MSGANQLLEVIERLFTTLSEREIDYLYSKSHSSVSNLDRKIREAGDIENE